MLNRVSKRQKAIQKLKFIQKFKEAFLKNLSTPIFGTGELGLNHWNNKVYSTNVINSGLICTRDFSSFKSRKFLLRRISFDQIHEQSRKHFLKHTFMTKCKLPLSNKPTSAMSVCYLTVPPSILKFCGFIKKYFLPLLPCHESINSLRSALYPKFVTKLSFSKTCCKKDSQFLECLESLKLASKYLTCFKYLLKRKLLPPELCEQYFPSCFMSHSTCSHSLSECSRNISKNIPTALEKLSKSQRNKTHKIFVHRVPCYPIFLHRVQWRGFHSSLFPLAKSDSSKPSACKGMDEICKPTEVSKTDECDKSCKEKSDVCRQEKIKCIDKSQQKEEETRQKPKEKIVDSECRKTCLPIGKCELPRTVPPPKMEYAKVTCSPPKFAKSESCPEIEQFQKSHVKTKTNVQKKQICVSLPLPKPPYAPIILCPCPPPPKLHPGSCPCYETKVINNNKQLSIQRPCPLKKKYPCPTGVYYCPLQKKPCNLKRETVCKDREKKKASTS